MKIVKALRQIRGPDCIMVTVTMAIIPLFYLAEVVGVLPHVCDKWSFWYNFHFAVSLFLLHNIIGNLGRGMQGPGTVQDAAIAAMPSGIDWRYCAACSRECPPRSWHCSVCEMCVLKRDHHCNFFGCCVGYRNYRYFFVFVAHVFVATMYAFGVNCAMLVQYAHAFELGMLSLLTFVFPFASLIVDGSRENWCVALVVVNIVFMVFTGYLFVYHSMLLVRGRTVGESKHRESVVDYDNGWRHNVVDAFGSKWYLVWISPFVFSPLPGDGIHWKRSFE